ncbi:DUF3450 domain-containing protein [Vibrio sp. JC009]|uniref:hypothetical protein n=1 Tax=Vibrio sp. JC009 TaxID=2912314 RepID=UPI0023AFF46B|nr:hypothetical protein [Vibrio sp. JC009]WED24308.1 DUF3450 domain-containing protein [Vibrio sp. JC009]
MIALMITITMQFITPPVLPKKHKAGEKTDKQLMSNNLNVKTVSGLIGAILGLASGNLLASDLEKSELLEQQIVAEARESQKRVDTSSDNAFEL